MARPRSSKKKLAKAFPIDRALASLAELTKTLDVPVVSLAARVSEDPWEVLSACILSLRTKDSTTVGAVERLFARARTPSALLEIPEEELARIIYPVGFYRTKAKVLREIAGVLVREHGGRVPDELEGLLELKGVGRKTANLVLVEAFGKPGICVDTHVHRITNRWGYVKTRSPDETELALRERLPKKWWLEINRILVAFGQGLCGPISPRCSECPIEKLCPKLGVKHRR